MIMMKNIWKSNLIQLPLNETIEIPSMIIVVRVVFHENNKYYPQVFWDEYLHKFWII